MDPMTLDKQRVSLLLNINTVLIQKSIILQQQLSVLQNSSSAAPQMIPKLTELLQHHLKRLHSNLTCIGELSEKFNHNGVSSKQIFPNILTPPPDSIELNDMYANLQQLFPDGVQILQRRESALRQEQLKRQGQFSNW